jgi:hypothetical protein
VKAGFSHILIIFRKENEERERQISAYGTLHIPIGMVTIPFPLSGLARLTSLMLEL